MQTPSRLRTYIELVRLMTPILVGQLGMIVVAFADNVMVGNYATDALASASFVNTVFNVSILGIIGFTYGITPLAGALFTRGSARDIGALMRNAVYANAFFGALMIAAMTVLYFFLDRLGQPPELLPLIRTYYLIILAGMVPTVFFNVFMQWSYAINNTRMPMWIILAANGLNVVGNYALIYGHWGMPQLGLEGAGISTFVARMVCALAIIAVFCFSSRYKEYLEGYRKARARKQDFWKITRTSFPVSIQLMCESGSFSAAGIMAGWLGAIELASLQVIIVVGTLGFCVYYALGAAVAVKVSNAAGRGDADEMRMYAWRGYHIMLVLMVTASLTFVLAGRHLMGIFSQDDRVIGMATALIGPLVLYQLGDATQVNFANALRGTSRVMPMLWIALVSYIVVGIPATYLMTFVTGWGMYGLISSFSVSLFLAGALFLWYFLRASR